MFIFFRSAFVCESSLNALIPENGLLHRGTAFEIDGIHDLFKQRLLDFEYITMEDDFKKRGMDQVDEKLYPLAADGIKIKKIFRSYISNFVDLYYKDEASVQNDKDLNGFWKNIKSNMQKLPDLNLHNLKEVLAEILFRVTVYHQNIGNALAPLQDPAGVGIRIVKDQLLSSVEGSFVQGVVTMVTTVKTPTMISRWDQMFFGAAELKVYHEFSEALQLLSSEITELNKHRLPFVDCDPRYCALSVSS